MVSTGGFEPLYMSSLKLPKGFIPYSKAKCANHRCGIQGSVVGDAYSVHTATRRNDLTNSESKSLRLTVGLDELALSGNGTSRNYGVPIRPGIRSMRAHVFR